MNEKQYFHYVQRALIFFPLIALIVSPSFVLFPTTNGKMMLFIAVVSVLIPAWLWIARDGEKKTRGLSYISLGLISFFVSMIVSGIFGVDFLQSMWGTDARGLGIGVWLWLLMYYCACAAIFIDEKNRLWYAWSVSMLGVIAAIPAIISVLQHGFYRVESVFGNPLLYANMGLFPVFFSLYCGMKEKNNTRKMIAFACACIAIIGVLLTESRGAGLGLVLGLIVSIALWFWSKTMNFKRIIIALIIGLCALFFLWFLKDVYPFSSLPMVQRLTTINVTESSASQRIILWKTAWKAFGERPMFGWGPENFDYPYDRFFDPEQTKFGFSQTWADRAHNQFLDVLVMQGLFGFLIFLAMTGYALYATYMHGAHEDRHEFFIFGLMIAYLTQSLFAFGGPASAVLWVGVLSWISAREKKYVRVPIIPFRVLFGIVGLVTVATWLILFLSYRSSHAMKNAEQAITVDERLLFIDRVFSAWSPRAYEYRQRAANLLFEKANRAHPSDAARQLQRAIDIVNIGIQKNPQRFSYVFTAGNVLTKATFILDTKFAQEADHALAASLALSPQRAAIYFQRANLRTVLGDYEGALDMLDRAVAISPDASQALYVRGLILTYSDRVDEGLQNIWQSMIAQRPYRPQNIDELKRIARLSIMNKRYDLASRAFVLLVIDDVEQDDHWFNVEKIIDEPQADLQFVRDTLVDMLEDIDLGAFSESYRPRIMSIINRIEALQ